jgi:conserved repeat domain
VYFCFGNHCCSSSDFFCGAVSADTTVNDVVLTVSPGIAGESQLWNVSFHINQGLVNETNGFFITFDQSFVVDDPFDPECITVWSDGCSAHPHRVIIIHNPNASYPLYQPGTTTVKFNNPMDIPFNSDVLISFSCGVHTDCPINCSGYHVWANTDVESYPVESNYVYISVPVTAGAGNNGLVQSPDGILSPPDHTQVFSCGSEPVYSIIPDSSYYIQDVTVNGISVVDDPNYILYPDGHAEYVFDPLHCDQFIYAGFEFEIPPPDLYKTTSDSIVTPGSIYHYTIGYNNPNELLYTGVFITDPLPEEVDFISASGNYTLEGRTVRWDIGSLLPFQSGNVTLMAMVNGSAPAGAFLNCAMMHTDQSGPVENCTEVTVIIPPVITKTAPADVVAPAETFTYSITYENPNSVSLTGASITDAIPADLVFLDAPGGSYNNGTVTWSLGTLAPNETGTVTLTVHVGYLVPPGTDIINCASMYTDLFEPVENCTDVRVLFIPVINKTAPAELVLPGETFTYSIAYENPNSVSLTGVSLTDYIEPDLVFVNATGNWSFEDDVVTWPLGTLAPNETGTVTLTVSVMTDVSPGTEILNCAELGSDQFEEPVFDCTDVTVVVPPLLEKTAPAELVAPGETFTYSIAYENPNSVNITGALLTDAIPANLTFVNATGDWSFDDDVVIWPLGTLAPNETGTVTLTASVKTDVVPGLVIWNCAVLETDRFEPVLACTDVTVIIRPLITKTAPVDIVGPGEIFTYTIAYENPDSVNLTGVSITDIIPPDLVFVNATGDWSFVDDTVTWSLGTLAPDETGTVTLTVSVMTDVPAGTVIMNCAELLTDQFEPVTDCTDVTVEGCTPTVELTKVSSREEVAPGESFIYTIRYKNSCECGPITGVVVRDHLPDEVIFVSATHSGVYDGNNVTWSLGTVEACEEGELNIVVRVPLIAVDPRVTNIATLFYNPGKFLTATADTIIDPSRIPDPRNVLVYPPVPKFVSIPKSGTAPLYVRFIDFSSGKPTSWLWDFGDNTTSWLKNPRHVYTTPGSYTVTLTATNDWGANTTIHNSEIQVNNPIFISGPQVQPTDNQSTQSTGTNYTSPYDRFVRTGKSPFSSLFG